MIVKTYSYRFADEILSAPGYCEVKEEIINICLGCPIPIYPGKSVRQPNKEVVQQIMNTYFRLQFEAYGWEVEPLATPNAYDDELRADFRKTFRYNNGDEITAQIEVEFANVASSYRNYFKFQLSFSYGLADVCILIVPSYDLANRIDSGVSNYEKATREIPQAKLSITVPILVIGLFDRDNEDNMLGVWNVADEGVSLDIAQNKNRLVRREHEDLVWSYIDWLNNQ